MTPLLSVDACHVSLTEPLDGSVYASAEGAVGAWVSPLSPSRVTVLLLAETLPAASLARTK